ncbi:ABC transporter substrate-binding protein [Inquilinus limosus]|uniref:ABC transporter substrate-binding protein n=1 Tax=Inquilinus limosus TaxID=171674 RepID=UPI00040BCF0C|nr:ABC transporter substrate-binding protein [Inquilinus limosus]
MRRTVWAVSAAVALAAPMAAAQTLEVATDQSPVGLDPHVATSFASVLVNGPVYEGLTAIDKDLRVVPELAESWTVSPDGLTYVFTLRPGAKFHDGSPVTPADVAASFARVRDPKTGSPYASRIDMVKSVEPTGDRQVTVTLTTPSAPFLANLPQIVIVPAAAATGGIDLQRKTAGTGPFTLKEWVPDTYLLLAKAGGYWEPGLPKLDAVKINIVPEASTRQVGLSGGTYQLLPNVDPATAATLQGTPGVTLLETTDLSYTLVGMNVSKPPFDNPKVRQALNTAIDRAQIVEAAYFGKGQPGGPLSPALKDWALPVSDYPCYAADPEKAKALLAEAGVALPVKAELKVLGSNQLVVDVAQVVQAQLNAAGFEVALNVQEQGTFIQDWRNSNFQLFASINGGNVDPDGYLYRTFRTGGSTNVFKYSDAEVDRLLDQGRTTLDPAKRREVYADVQKRLACDGPIAHLVFGQLFTAVRDGVTGYEIVGNRSTRSLRQTALEK